MDYRWTRNRQEWELMNELDSQERPEANEQEEASDEDAD